MTTRSSLRARAAALLTPLALLALFSFDAGLLRVSAAGSPQPPQRGGRGSVITVSTPAELQAALDRATPGSTILIRPGTYPLTRSLMIRGALSDLTIRGATDNAADVVLTGSAAAAGSFDTVPHGIVVESGARSITIANLTIRDVAQHAIVLKAGTRAPRIQNVHLADAGAGLIAAEGDARRGGSRDGVIESSILEYTAGAPDAGIRGIEIAGGTGWTIRQNVFRNIQAPLGQIAGPALLVWQGSRDTIVDGNLFVNSQREIALGLEDRSPDDHTGGIVRNNFIYRDSTIQGGAAILLADAPGAQVLHNTILVNGSYTSPIEYRVRDGAGVVIRNNLLDGTVAALDRASGTVGDNFTQATPSMFVNAAGGDLHLADSALAAFDQVPALSAALLDVDGQPRAADRPADYGADERTEPFAAPPRAEPLPQPIPDAAQTPLPASSPQTSSPGATEPADLKTAVADSIAGALPEPWESMDIGNTLRGLEAWTGDTFVIQGGGADISGSADHFRFVYQPFEGDGEIVAQVSNLEPTHPWAKAGVMIRDELTPDAKYAGALITAGKGLVFQRRIAAGATTTLTRAGSAKAPYWLKLVRSADLFTAYASEDGATWSVIGSEIVYLKRRVYAGLAVTSHSTRSRASAHFRNVGVAASPETPNEAPTVAITSPANGSQYTSPATVEITAAATDPDGTVNKVEFYAGSTMIGAATTSPFGVTWSSAPAGSHLLKAVAHDDRGATTSSPAVEVEVLAGANKPPVVSLTSPSNGAMFTAPATITLKASASDPDGAIARVDFYSGSDLIGSDTASPYELTWNGVAAGSYTFKAVARDDDGATGASAAVSATVAPPANQAPSVALTAPAPGTSFSAPASIALSATAADPDGTITKVEFFAGSTLVGSASTSPYGFTWNGAPAGSHTLTAKAWDNAGMAAVSDAVTITIEDAPALPPGWSTQDLGNPAIAGSAGFSEGVFTVTGAGQDIWGHADQFRFVYQPIDGDRAIQACATSVELAHDWAKAGVMFRESLTSNSPHAFMLLSADRGDDLQYRALPGGESRQHGPQPATAPHCLRLVRQGNTFSGYRSTDGVSWQLAWTQVLDMSASAYVGLAVTSHNASRSATARFEQVELTEPPPNQPPSVSLTAPAAGATFTAPATVTFSASASDPDGTIAAVDFYASGVLLGSDTSNSYSISISGMPEGTYEVTAVARDNAGATTTSPPVSMTVSGAPEGLPRLLIFTASPDHDTLVTSYAVEVFVAGANPATTAPVRIQNVGKPTPVNGDITVDVSATIQSLPAGSYFMTATATGSSGTTRSGPTEVFER